MKKMLMCILILMLVSVCTLPVRAQTPGQAFVDMKRADHMRDIKNSGSAIKNIESAIKNGNLQKLQAFEKQYSRIIFSFTFEDRMSPLCLAAKYGRYNIVEYLLKGKKVSVDSYCLEVAIENKRPQTAKVLLDYGAKDRDGVLLFSVANNFKALTDLNKLIPPLLTAGSKLDGQQAWNHPYAFDRADVFWWAARRGNTNFITALRDAMKKKNMKPVAHYTYVRCQDYYLTSWGASQASIDKEKKDGINRIKNSKEGKLLASYQVPLSVGLEYTDGSSCE